MKKSFIFALVLAPALSIIGLNLGEISRAINNGDADTLGRYFATEVEITFFDDGDEYDKTAGIKAVKNFFSKHKPLSFVQVHQGKSKGSAAHYSIGNMETKDATFRVYIYLEKSGTEFKIQELRFDKE